MNVIVIVVVAANEEEEEEAIIAHMFVNFATWAYGEKLEGLIMGELGIWL